MNNATTLVEFHDCRIAPATTGISNRIGACLLALARLADLEAHRCSDVGARDSPLLTTNRLAISITSGC